MNNFEIKRDKDLDEGAEEIYSKVVRAGRRTYFFDVKATRNDDYYITVTESRKKTEKDGRFSFEKHKIHLYKEDFCEIQRRIRRGCPLHPGTQTGVFPSRRKRDL